MGIIITLISQYIGTINLLLLVATICLMWLLPYLAEKKRQLNILKNILTELEILSSNEEKIKMWIKEYPRTGNLQWVNVVLKNRIQGPVPDSWIATAVPAHNVLRISDNYLAALEEVVDGANTKLLKKFLIIINQKIEMLNGFLEKARQKDTPFSKSSTQHADEIIEMVEEAKSYINQTWKLEKVGKDFKHMVAVFTLPTLLLAFSVFISMFLFAVDKLDLINGTNALSYLQMSLVGIPLTFFGIVISGYFLLKNR